MSTNTARKSAPKATASKAKANAPVPQSAPATKAELTAIEVARQNVAKKAKAGVGVTLHTSGAPIKGLAAEPVVARPQRKMLRTIDTIVGHPGKGNCVKRFHLYKVGMTLLDAKVTEGLIPSDITFYAELGYLTLRDATDEEYNAAVAKWEADKAKAEKEAAAA